MVPHCGTSRNTVIVIPWPGTKDVCITPLYCTYNYYTPWQYHHLDNLLLIWDHITSSVAKQDWSWLALDTREPNLWQSSRSISGGAILYHYYWLGFLGCNPCSEVDFFKASCFPAALDPATSLIDESVLVNQVLLPALLRDKSFS